MTAFWVGLYLMVQSRHWLPFFLFIGQSSNHRLLLFQWYSNHTTLLFERAQSAIHTVIGKDKLEVLSRSSFLGKKEEQLMEWWTDGFAFMACWKDCHLHRVHRGEGFALLVGNGKENCC
uniref:Uncharacterized protein n=1 Tax=Grammatophora oceanica TaxID=210454 RepID=A0A6U5PCQ8_9STRA|mmetsp:Transcript_52259/g.78065  ORF Transcript_52259/g.78065 Transcript_52259/m.78065 type:complete len:119 (+) Transcript_52259:130-486(+)